MSDQPSTREGPPERSPWSRPSVVLSGAFLLLLLLLGAVVAVIDGGGGSRHRSTPNRSLTTPAPTLGAPPQSASASASDCSLAAGSQIVPSASPPPGTAWQQVGSMQAPQAPSTLGPRRSSGVWSTCFAHSPSGALLAAFNLWAEGTAAPSGDVYRHLAVDVPSQAYLTATRLDDQGPVQFAGYRYQSYTPSTARILIVGQGPQGKLGSFATTMRWAGRAWRYLFPSGGQLAVQVIPDLSGYVQWSAF